MLCRRKETQMKLSPVKWERNDRGWMGLSPYGREKMCCFLSFASWADATIHQSFVKYRTDTWEGALQTSHSHSARDADSKKDVTISKLYSASISMDPTTCSWSPLPFEVLVSEATSPSTNSYTLSSHDTLVEVLPGSIYAIAQFHCVWQKNTLSVCLEINLR